MTDSMLVTAGVMPLLITLDDVAARSGGKGTRQVEIRLTLAMAGLFYKLPHQFMCNPRYMGTRGNTTITALYMERNMLRIRFFMERLR